MENMVWEYRRAMVLSGFPVEGSYRFADEFEILPADPEAPKPPGLLDHHPFTIEYRFIIDETPRKSLDGNRIPQWIIDNKNSFKTLKEIILLLTTFSQYRVFIYSNNQSWFIPIGKMSKEPKTKEIQWGQECYMYEGFDNKIESFTDTKSEQIKLIEANKFFNRYGIRVDQNKLDFPENISNLFALYFSLEEGEKRAFLSSCSLFDQGMKLWSEHPSLSFAAIVSSIETLITFEHKDEKTEICKACGQKRYRVIRKFQDFFGAYGSPTPEFKKYSQEIYKYRSKILHRGELVFGEIEPRPFVNMVVFEDDQFRRSIITTCRICLVNWLLNIQS